MFLVPQNRRGERLTHNEPKEIIALYRATNNYEKRLQQPIISLTNDKLPFSEFLNLVASCILLNNKIIMLGTLFLGVHRNLISGYLRHSGKMFISFLK